MEKDPRAAALAFLKSNDLGDLATLSKDGSPRARTLYYAAADDFSVYFVTLANTRKVEDILANGRAAFVVSAPDAPQTLQMEGIVSDHTETALIDESVRSLMDTLFAKGSRFAPLTHLDAAVVRFFKLTPSWIRWGDFTDGDGTDKSFAEIRP